MTYKRGMDTERKAVNFLENKGISAVRVCGSGAGSKRPRPDVLASDGINDYGIEVKSSTQDYIMIEDSQIKRLIEFCKGFGAIPLVCVKFSYKPFLFLKLNQLRLTRNGNYKVRRGEFIKSVL